MFSSNASIFFLNILCSGNGIQDLTYDDPSIFYLSIHRACFSKKQKNWFYPGTGKPSEIGDGYGAGTNLNIVFGEGGMCLFSRRFSGRTTMASL
jgi:hypothetical protein